MTAQGGTPTNSYGLYANAQTGATNNYAATFMGGNVGIGTVTPVAPLEVKGTGTGATIAKFTDNNTTGCTIADGGTIACSSDERLKKNVEDISYGLDAVMSLRPVLYNWKYEGDGSIKNLGFLAQDVGVLIPKLVTTDIDGMKSLNTTGMIPVLTKAVQELNLNLQAAAGTANPVPGSSAGIFTTAFFNNIYGKIGAWLANTQNGIVSLFADEINTKNLCVSDDAGEKTCVTKSQLDNLLNNAGKPNSPSGKTSAPPSVSNESNTVDIIDIMEQVDTETLESATSVESDILNPQTEPVLDDLSIDIETKSISLPVPIPESISQ